MKRELAGIPVKIDPFAVDDCVYAVRRGDVAKARVVSLSADGRFVYLLGLSPVDREIIGQRDPHEPTPFVFADVFHSTSGDLRRMANRLFGYRRLVRQRIDQVRAKARQLQREGK